MFLKVIAFSVSFQQIFLNALSPSWLGPIMQISLANGRQSLILPLCPFWDHTHLPGNLYY